MTGRKAVYGMLLAGALILSAVYEVYQAALLLLILLILPLISALYCFYVKNGIEISLEEPQLISEKGQEITIHAEIRNKRLLPAARVDLMIGVKNGFSRYWSKSGIVSALNGRSAKVLSFTLQSDYCGKIRVCIEAIHVYDAMLFLRMSKRLGIELHTTVLPEIHPMAPRRSYPLMEQLEGDSFSPFKPGGDPSEIFDVREYVNGDKFRRVHWKLSLKQEKLMIKEYSSPMDDSVTLLIDLCVGAPDDYMEAVDAILDEAFSLSAHLIERDVLHRINWFDTEKDEMFSVKIRDEHDLYEAMGRVLGISVYQGRMMGVFSLDIRHRRYTHVFLFLPNEAPEYADELIPISDRLSVFYILREDAGETRPAVWGDWVPVRLSGMRRRVKDAS
jgi:uncharacterized protein (DUF58 family)